MAEVKSDYKININIALSSVDLTWCLIHVFLINQAMTIYISTRSIMALPSSIYRSIAIRRYFFLIGTLYLYRCVTMYITTLPVPGMHMTCAPKVSPIQTPEWRSAVVIQTCTTTQPLRLILQNHTREAASKTRSYSDFLLAQDMEVHVSGQRWAVFNYLYLKYVFQLLLSIL